MDAVIKLGGDLKLLKSPELALLNNINVSPPLAEEVVVTLKQTVAEKQEEYILLFIKLLNNIHMENAVTVLLTVLQTLCESTSFSAAFAKIGHRHAEVDPFEPFMALLNKSSGTILEKNYAVLGSLLSVSNYDWQAKRITVLLDNCLALLGQDQDMKMVEIAVHTLTLLLRNPDIRTVFTAKNGIPLLTSLVLTNISNVQLIYEIGFCLWMLSYNDTCIVALLKHNAIALLHDILRNSKKEKCARVALMTLKNLVRLQMRQHGYTSSEENEFLPDVPTVDADNQKFNIFGDMITLGMVRTLQLMSKRSFGDSDILTEVESLLELLEKKIEDTTSSADYKQEVFSGRLDWTPVHKSEKFWKENIKEFEKDDFKILRTLSHLLQTSQDNKTLTIILYDLGEFVKYHPQGRKILNALDVKPRIVALMGNENQDVSKQALLCTQKIMVQKWEFLSS
eukprot:RCo015285